MWSDLSTLVVVVIASAAIVCAPALILWVAEVAHDRIPRTDRRKHRR